MANVRHVQPACGNIRSNQETQATIAERRECFHTLALLQITVDRGCIEAVFLHGLRNDIYVHLAVAKDDTVTARICFTFDQLTQKSALFTVLTVTARAFEHINGLGDIVVRGCRAGNFNFGRVRQESVCDPLNLGRHCCAEKQRLAGEGCKAKDTLDVGNEAHVEHPVRFVDDHDFHV